MFARHPNGDCYFPAPFTRTPQKETVVPADRVWQPAMTDDGNISTEVMSSVAQTATNAPYDLAGIVLRFSADTNFLILQV